MSEILHGVLNMPPELWCNDEVSILQRHSCYLEASRLIKELEQRLAAAEAKIPDKPLGVFSEGVWVFATTAQTFTAEDLDIAAFVKYRDYMKGGE